MALTGWEVLERCERSDGLRFARVALTPVTGRPHQLRRGSTYYARHIVVAQFNASLLEYGIF